MHERWAGFLGGDAPGERPPGAEPAGRQEAATLPVRPAAAAAWDDVPTEEERRRLVRRPYGIAALLGGGLVVLAVVTGGATGAGGGAGADQPLVAPTPATADAGGGQATPASADDPSDASFDAAGSNPSSDPAAALPPAAMAIAALEVRRQLSDAPWGDRAGQAGDERADERQYVDAAEAEAAVAVGDVVVVSVVALMLRSQGEAWATASRERFAIALQRTGDGLAVLGPPWPLPARAPEPARTFKPAGDAEVEAAVADVLAAAGWADVADVRSGGAPAGWQRVRVRARAPSAAQIAEHELWLLDDGGAPVLVDPAAHAATRDDPRRSP